MIRHVAIFNWTDNASTAEIAAFAAGLSAMPDNVPGILRYEHGDDLQLSDRTADYVVVADFATVEDYRAYSSHPYHLAFIADLLRPITASATRVQYHVA